MDESLIEASLMENSLTKDSLKDSKRSVELIEETINATQERSSSTRAYLIGTGPGSLDYLTLKAIAAISRCEALLVDELVNKAVLQFAAPDCEIISVGKKPGKHSMPQDQILEIFLGKLKEGKITGRLKGGDPFVFGRGGEEMLALMERAICFEVINGITAGIAAPAAIGIPVTHRGLALSATFITGHSCNAIDQPEWRALVASKSTLVIYMGLSRLAEICRTLIQNGMAEDTASAVIQNGTLESQRSVKGTLGELPALVESAALSSPAIIVIGAVADLSNSSIPMHQIRALSTAGEKQ